MGRRKAPVSRPSKLTPQLRDVLLTALGAGAPIHVACRAAGIHAATFHRWMAMGRGEHEKRGGRDHKDLVAEVERAVAVGDLDLLHSVRTTISGKICGKCAGEGFLLGEGKPKCDACGGTGWAVKPDGKLGLQFLALRHEEFRKPERVEIAGSVEVSGNLEVDVNVSLAALTVDLSAMSAEQLAALSSDVIDAEEPLQIEAAK